MKFERTVTVDIDDYDLVEMLREDNRELYLLEMFGFDVNTWVEFFKARPELLSEILILSGKANPADQDEKAIARVVALANNDVVAFHDIIMRITEGGEL